MNPTPAPLTATQRRVVVQVLLHGPLSRAELARRTDLSMASSARVVRELVDAGLLVERAPVISGRSRPTVPIDLESGSAHVLGVNVTATHLNAGLFDIRGNLLTSQRFRVDGRDADAVVDAVATLAKETDATRIGIGLGGDTTDGRTVSSAGLLQWGPTPLAQCVEEATGLPCSIGNDVEALTLGEGWFGVARDTDNFLILTIGAGIGFASVRAGQIVRGRDGGQLVGWIRLTDPADETTALAQDFLSNESLLDYYRQLSDPEPALSTPRELKVASRQGDHSASEAAQVWARRTGILAATAAAFTFPDTVFIMGEGGWVGEDFPQRVREGMETTWSPEVELPRVQAVEHDRMHWARGAAVLAIRQLLGLEERNAQAVRLDPPTPED